MKTEEFITWMQEFCDFSDRTIDNRISNCTKVEEYYGDLDDNYKEDECLKILYELSYSTKDERNNVVPKHNIPINGNIRNGSGTYKSAVKLYTDFRKDFTEEEEEEDNEPLKLFDETPNHKKNGFDLLYKLVKQDNDFISFFVESSYFIAPEYVKRQAKEMLETIKKEERLPVRFSLRMKKHFKSAKKQVSAIKNRKDAVSYSRAFDFFSKERSFVKVEFDSTGNKAVVDAIEKYTKCRVSTSQSNIINFSISHVWAQTFDPLFFSSLWNTVLVPSFLNPIMDKPSHQQKINGEVQSIIRAICIELYNPNKLFGELQSELPLIENESEQVHKHAQEIISKGLISYIDFNDNINLK